MLNGIDPIIIFNFSKLLPSLFQTVSKIPVVADNPTTFPLPFIPIYLSERLTGIYIDSESKSMDVDTEIDTTSNGDTPKFYQKGLSNVVKIEAVAKRDSIGISLLSAMMDQIFKKVTSKEYSITYLHGPITVFGGLLHAFAISQDASTDLYKISLELQLPSAGSLIKTPVPVVDKATGTIPLGAQ